MNRHIPKIEREFFESLKNDMQQGDHLRYAGTILAYAAKKSPQATALICKEQSVSYRELYARACAVSEFLQNHGIKPGDRVLICFENSIEFYVAYFGAWQMGAVVAPLNTFLQEKELAHVLHDAQPAAILCSPDKREQFEKSGTQLPPLFTSQDFPQSAEGIADRFEPVVLNNDDMCALLYTSGTTGLPKGVMLSSNNIINNVMQGLARLRITSYERVFGVLPLFHSFAQFACVWGAIYLCATVIVIPKIDRRSVLEGLKQKPTFFLGVPALYGLLCLLKTLPLEQVKYFVSGGDALPDRIAAAFGCLYHRKISSGYGLTETSPLISVDFDDELKPIMAVGMPCINIDIEIRDEEGKPLPDEQVGELWVRGPNVMLGYYNAPEETKKVIQNGWLRTGDLAYTDRKGRIVIAGRLKDLIIHKGFNIYPPEVENIIILHPNVMGVGVVGKPDETLGEIPVAFVRIKDAKDTMEQELRELCAHHLAAYKIPKTFICTTDQLPTTATGKVDKKELRKRL